MNAIVVRNSREGSAPPPAPMREDGSLYPFCMTYDGGKYLAFADSTTDLMGVLVEGYEDLDEAGRLTARIRLAVAQQSALQAVLTTQSNAEDLEALTEAERAVLHGPRHIQPEVDFWDSPVPLVLVESGYEPYKNVPKPISGISDVVDPPNIVWLRPVQEDEFVESLHNAGAITLHEAADI